MENIDLSPADRKKIAVKILRDIDEWCVQKYNDGHRNHLGGSAIGNPCDRALWYSFRWVRRPVFSGRMLRLFNRGHREEIRFVEWLRGIGFTVDEFQADGKSQWRISDCSGHFGGSLDGMVKLPTGYADFASLPPMLLEFKTSGTGGAFNKLVSDGVKIAKPVHFAQMSTYGKRYELRYALYMCINKNDDDIHVEIVELDWELADKLTQKAQTIINSPFPLKKLSDNSAYFECKFCDFHEVCHKNMPYEKNCRSCKFAVPVENGEWRCGHFNGVIPADFIPKGCDNWEAAT